MSKVVSVYLNDEEQALVAALESALQWRLGRVVDLAARLYGSLYEEDEGAGVERTKDLMALINPRFDVDSCGAVYEWLGARGLERVGRGEYTHKCAARITDRGAASLQRVTELTPWNRRVTIIMCLDDLAWSCRARSPEYGVLEQRYRVQRVEQREAPNE